MVWICEITEQYDDYKRHGSDTFTRLAETKEEAQKHAVLWLLERLDDDEFYKFDEDNSWYNLGKEDIAPFCSGDWKTVYKYMVESIDRLFKGEFVHPLVEISVYERPSNYDRPDEARLNELLNSAKALLSQEEEDAA